MIEFFANLPRRCAAALVFLATLLGVVASVHAAPTILAHGYTMVGDATRMRIILYFDSKPHPDSFLLRDPYRLVIDFPQTKLGIDPDAARPRGFITAVHYGQLDAETSRIVLAADSPFSVENLAVSANEGFSRLSHGPRPGRRLARKLRCGARKAGRHNRVGANDAEAGPGRQCRRPRATSTSPSSSIRGTAASTAVRRASAARSKRILPWPSGCKLRKKLESEGKYDVYMTRDDDTYISLDDRVAFAREHNADLMISIHADSIHLPGMRGATVYTVSDKASDAESAALAARENLSDQLAGMKVSDDNHEVSDILLDLVKRETFAYSMRFARSLVGELSQSINLVNNPHRYAGFRVLEAPDVPSVLLELGYLSNKKDETDLCDPDWRQKTVDGIVTAIDRFVAARAGG